MAGELIWALEALDAIDAIARYIARDSAVHARRFVSEIPELGELFLTLPPTGRRTSMNIYMAGSDIISTEVFFDTAYAIALSSAKDQCPDFLSAFIGVSRALSTVAGVTPPPTLCARRRFAPC